MKLTLATLHNVAKRSLRIVQFNLSLSMPLIYYKKASGNENAYGNEVLIYAREINDTYPIHFA
jgi:hypothetical protein